MLPSANAPSRKPDHAVSPQCAAAVGTATSTSPSAMPSATSTASRRRSEAVKSTWLPSTGTGGIAARPTTSAGAPAATAQKTSGSVGETTNSRPPSAGAATPPMSPTIDVSVYARRRSGGSTIRPHSARNVAISGGALTPASAEHVTSDHAGALAAASAANASSPPAYPPANAG